MAVVGAVGSLNTKPSTQNRTQRPEIRVQRINEGVSGEFRKPWTEEPDPEDRGGARPDGDKR